MGEPMTTAALFVLKFTVYCAFAFEAIGGFAFVAHMRDVFRLKEGTREYEAEAKGARDSLIGVILFHAWIMACRAVLPLVSP